MDVFDLVAKISVDTSEYEKGLNGASNESKSFASKLGSGLKTAAKVGAVALTAVTTAGTVLGKTLVKGVDQVASYGDNVDKMSQKMGISAQAYQEWDAIMQHSGTSIEALKPSMKTLATAAQSGAEEFQKLGISEQEVANLSQEDLFAKVITGLQNMEEGTERTAITAKLLGRGATELGALLNTSAEDTEKMRQRVHELGGVMSDEGVKASAKFKDNLQDMKTAISGVKRSIASEFLPAMSDIMDGFTKLIAGEEGAEESINKGMDEFSNAVEKIAPKIGDIISVMLPKLLEAGGIVLLKLAEQLPKMINMLAQQAPTLIRSLVNTITKIAPELIKAGVNLVVQLAVGLMKAIPDLVAAVPDIIIALVDAITDPSNLEQLFTAGFDLIIKMFEGLLSGDFASKALEIIEHLVTGLINAAGGLLDAGFKAIEKFFDGLFSGDFLGNAGEIISKLGDAIVGAAMGLLGAGAKVVQKIWEGMKSAWNAVSDWISKVIYGTVNNVAAEVQKFQGVVGVIADPSGGSKPNRKQQAMSTGSSYAATAQQYTNVNNTYIGGKRVNRTVSTAGASTAATSGGR